MDIRSLKNRREPVQVTESSIVLYGNCHDYCEEGQEGHDRYPDGPEDEPFELADPMVDLLINYGHLVRVVTRLLANRPLQQQAGEVAFAQATVAE